MKLNKKQKFFLFTIFLVFILFIINSCTYKGEKILYNEEKSGSGNYDDYRENCNVIGNKCCKGDVCSEVSVYCKEDYSAEFKGCDGDCNAIVGCKPEKAIDDDNDYEFEKIISSGNPKRKINFMFIADDFSRENKDIFLRIANEWLFGSSDPYSIAFFKNNVYKDAKDKFNIYYFIKYNEDYGNYISLSEKSSKYYEKLYSDLKNLEDDGVEIREEIDYFIFITSNITDRGTSRIWPNPSIEFYADEILTRTNFIYLSENYNVGTLFHELGHVIGGFGDEYYEEAKGWYLPILSKRTNIDSIGCPKWCSGNIDINSQCYKDYNDYLNCVKDIPTNDAYKQQLLGCFNIINKKLNNLNCNFGTNCQLNTGCYWLAQGTLGFRPYYNSIMNSNYQQNYEEYYAQKLRDKLISIKPQINKINLVIEPKFNHDTTTSQDGKDINYLFKIPFKIYFDDSQQPSIFFLNGRHYTITFDVNISNINTNQPIRRAPIFFNDDQNGYVAHYTLTKQAKEGFDIKDSDKFQVRLFVRYDNVTEEKSFVINLKEGKIENIDNAKLNKGINVFFQHFYNNLLKK